MITKAQETGLQLQIDKFNNLQLLTRSCSHKIGLRSVMTW